MNEISLLNKKQRYIVLEPITGLPTLSYKNLDERTLFLTINYYPLIYDEKLNTHLSVLEYNLDNEFIIPYKLKDVGMLRHDFILCKKNELKNNLKTEKIKAEIEE